MLPQYRREKKMQYPNKETSTSRKVKKWQNKCNRLKLTWPSNQFSNSRECTTLELKFLITFLII